MIIVRCLPFVFSGCYLTYAFLLIFVFSLLFLLIRR